MAYLRLDIINIAIYYYLEREIQNFGILYENSSYFEVNPSNF